MRKLVAGAVFTAALGTLACSTAKPLKADSVGAQLASVDLGLPDKTQMDAKTSAALTAYSLSFVPKAGCAAGRVDESDAYAAHATITATLSRQCTYDYELLLGTPAMLARGDAYYRGAGELGASDFAGKSKLDITIPLSATAAAQAEGLASDVDPAVSPAVADNVDVGIQATLPAAAQPAHPIATGNAQPGHPGSSLPADSGEAQPLPAVDNGSVDVTDHVLNAKDFIGSNYLVFFANETSCPAGYRETMAKPTHNKGHGCTVRLDASNTRDGSASGSVILSVPRPAETACPVGFSGTSDGARCEADINSSDFMAANGIQPV